MPRFKLQQAFCCRVILVAACCAAPAGAQSVEIVTKGGSLIFVSPDGGEAGGTAISVQPSDSARRMPLHVSSRLDEPLHEELPSPSVIAVSPAPVQPLTIEPKGEPLDVEGQRQVLSVIPKVADVGRQIAEALARDEVVRLRVNFDFDSANLRPESMPLIENIADALRTDPSLLIEVQGHTDDVGSQEYNQDLSERRASEVRRILIETFGIAEQRITAVGYGMSRPADPGATDDARAANRRVEIHYRAN